MESPLSFHDVLPILHSIIDRRLVQHITLPRHWRDERIDYREMEIRHPVHQFVIDYNRMLLDRRRLACCEKCNNCFGEFDWVELDEDNTQYGLQNYTCCRCIKSYCYDCRDDDNNQMLEQCDICERVCCQDCKKTMLCDSCDRYSLQIAKML